MKRNNITKNKKMESEKKGEKEMKNIIKNIINYIWAFLDAWEVMGFENERDAEFQLNLLIKNMVLYVNVCIMSGLKREEVKNSSYEDYERAWTLQQIRYDKALALDSAQRSINILNRWGKTVGVKFFEGDIDNIYEVEDFIGEFCFNLFEKEKEEARNLDITTLDGLMKFRGGRTDIYPTEDLNMKGGN